MNINSLNIKVVQLQERLPRKVNITMDRYRKLSRYVGDLVMHNAKLIDGFHQLSLDDLTDSEQGELVSLFIEYNDFDASDCYVMDGQRANEDDITASLFDMLKSNSLEDLVLFADRVRANSVKQYSAKMQELIDEICAAYTQEVREETRHYG